MDTTQLLAELKADLAASTGEGQTELSDDREKALKYYLGEPYGNEVEGRSSIVTTEVADTVEAMLPQILKPFLSSERVVYFDPVGLEDEEQAKQETAYVNHVFYKENPGARILYTFAKDGLLSKNGFIKYYYEEVEKVTTESYTGLNEEALIALLMEDDIEVLEQDSKDMLYSLKIRRTKKCNQVRAVNVPPEEIKLRPDYTDIDLQEVPFISHDREMRAGDVVAMGYDKDKVQRAASMEDSTNSEKQARFRNVAELSNNSGNTNDWTMQKVVISECYKRVDFDSDDYPELRKIVLLNGEEILENEEFDYVPFVSWTPVPMPHRFIGQSSADQAMDLQIQKSTLLRNIMDNLYQINNVRYEAVETEVAIEDLLDSTPGGVVRTTAPGMVRELTTQPLTGHPYQMLEYLDTIKENRTGSTRYNQGIDADSLNKTASGINRIMDASQQRLQLVATLFGEAIKRLMLGVHRLLIQNQDAEKVIKLNNEYFPINPSAWRARTNMTVVVGLGTENNDRQLQHLVTILQFQREALMGGLPITTLDHVYNTLSKYVEAANLKDPAQFWQDPKGVQMPQQPDPNQQIVEAQAQMEQMKEQNKKEIEQMKAQLKVMELRADSEKAMMQMQVERERNQSQAASNDKRLMQEAETARLKAELSLKTQEYEQARFMAKAAQDAEKIELEKYVAELRSETDVLTTKLKIAADGEGDDKDRALREKELKAQRLERKPEPKAKEAPQPQPQPQEIHIHQGSKKKVTVKRNEDGSLEGYSEDVDDG